MLLISTHFVAQFSNVKHNNFILLETIDDIEEDHRTPMVGGVERERYSNEEEEVCCGKQFNFSLFHKIFPNLLSTRYIRLAISPPPWTLLLLSKRVLVVVLLILIYPVYPNIVSPIS